MSRLIGTSELGCKLSNGCFGTPSQTLDPLCKLLDVAILVFSLFIAVVAPLIDGLAYLPTPLSAISVGPQELARPGVRRLPGHREVVLLLRDCLSLANFSVASRRCPRLWNFCREILAGQRLFVVRGFNSDFHVGQLLLRQTRRGLLRNLHQNEPDIEKSILVFPQHAVHWSGSGSS